MSDNRPKWMDGPADNEEVDYDLVREWAWKDDEELDESEYVDPQELRSLARELLRVRGAFQRLLSAIDSREVTK